MDEPNLLQAVGYFDGNYMIAVALMSDVPAPDGSFLLDYEPRASEIINSDAEVIEGSKISLNCPISKKRFRTPVKGHSCNHIQCFDFDNYVDINSRRPNWHCPHCSEPVSFTDIRIDQKMVEILEVVGPLVTEIVFSNGFWNIAMEMDGAIEKLTKYENCPDHLADPGNVNKVAAGNQMAKLSADVNHSIAFGLSRVLTYRVNNSDARIMPLAQDHSSVRVGAPDQQSPPRFYPGEPAPNWFPAGQICEDSTRHDYNNALYVCFTSHNQQGTVRPISELPNVTHAGPSGCIIEMEEESPEKVDLEEKARTLPTLPDDSVFKIMESLPVKSLARFRCVSKSWQSQTKDHKFIRRHQGLRRNNRVLLTRRFKEQKDILTFHPLNSKQLDDGRPILPTPFLDCLVGLERRNTILGPCSGLVCLLAGGDKWAGDISDRENIVLSNPGLQEFRTLPVSPFQSSFGRNGHLRAAGFGDIDTNDFKVVLVRYSDGRVEEGEPYSAVTLYSSGTGSWRQFKEHGIAYSLSIEGIFFNGKCHWHAIIRDNLAVPVLMCFDMTTETFSNIEYPDSVKEVVKKWNIVKVALLDDYMTLIQLHRAELQGLFVIDVWVMEEYGVKASWDKRHVIKSDIRLYPLCWLPDGNILMEESAGLVCVNPLTNEMIKFRGYWTYQQPGHWYMKKAFSVLHRYKPLRSISFTFLSLNI